MSVTGGMLLRLEQGVEVPEAALYEVVGWHLLESHLGEDLLELCPYLRCIVPSASQARRAFLVPFLGASLCPALAVVTHLQQRMQVASRWQDAHGAEVVLLELLPFPSATV